MKTQDWIDTPENLIATFSAKGKVFVDNQEQKSGTTANDFRKDVVYTVKAEDNTTRNYTVSLRSPQTTGLPVIKIDVEGGTEIVNKTESYYKAAIKVTDPDKEEYKIDSETGIRGRGNSTWWYDKKPYRLKFDKKTSMFGYGKAKSWVLLANYLDPTLIMNTVAFELGHRFGLPFTNHATHVELYMNGTYRGSYVLTEQVQVNEYRVNIDEETGFFVELDDYYDEDPKFKTNTYALPVMIKSPEELNDPSGYDFVKNDINALTDALGAPEFPNNGYLDLIDVSTFIDFMLVNEIVRNTEFQHPKSMYMYKKDPQSKICMGPLWDFDWGFGYAGHGHNYYTNPNEMLLRQEYKGDQAGYKFFCRFFDDPKFRQQYKARWNELKGKGLFDLDDFINQMHEKLNLSQAENFSKWNNNLIYSDQISKMKSWLKQRIAYLDAEINKY